MVFTDKEFRRSTLPQITKDCQNENDLEELKKKVRQFVRKFHQLLYHSFDNKEILVTSGTYADIAFF